MPVLCFHPPRPALAVPVIHEARVRPGEPLHDLGRPSELHPEGQQSLLRSHRNVGKQHCAHTHSGALAPSRHYRHTSSSSFSAASFRAYIGMVGGHRVRASEAVFMRVPLHKMPLFRIVFGRGGTLSKIGVRNFLAFPAGVSFRTAELFAKNDLGGRLHRPKVLRTQGRGSVRV